MTLPRLIKSSEFKIGDVVSRPGCGVNGSFCSCVVESVTRSAWGGRPIATLVRPYASLSGLVLPDHLSGPLTEEMVVLFGFQKFTEYMGDREWTLHDRRT